MKHAVLSFSLFFTMTFLLAGQETASAIDVPAPGKQVVQRVELPASTSVWKEKRESIGMPRPLDMSKTDNVHYWFFLPTDYEKQAETGGAPLLLFLHGAGERGNQSGADMAKVKVHGPPRLLDHPEFARDFPCITVSPQCKTESTWSPLQLMFLLDHIEKNYKVDKNRIYITGLSMGGFGTWMCLNESPDRFAAAAPICGGADIDWAKKMLNVPLWVFHGGNDPTVKPERSREMVDAIKKAGGKKVFLTLYEGVGHDSWTQTYNNQLFYDWLFQQSRDKTSPSKKSEGRRLVRQIRNGHP